MAKLTPRDRTIKKIQAMIERETAPIVSIHYLHEMKRCTSDAASKIYDYMNLRCQRAKPKKK